MEYEEAIRRLRDHFAIHDDGRPTPYLDEAEHMAIESLKKQIPKKLATNGENFGGMLYKFCPSCGHCMGLKPKASHCSECGQRIDLSEVE